MSSPAVVVVGPAGFIGKEIVPTFVNALQCKQLRSLTLLTRDSSSSKYDAFRQRGALVKQVRFDDKSALVSILRDSDVVVSCMGTQGDYKKNKHILMEACMTRKLLR